MQFTFVCISSPSAFFATISPSPRIPYTFSHSFSNIISASRTHTYNSIAPLFRTTSAQQFIDTPLSQFHAFVAQFLFPTPTLLPISRTDFYDYFEYVFPVHHTHPLPRRPVDIPHPLHLPQLHPLHANTPLITVHQLLTLSILHNTTIHFVPSPSHKILPLTLPSFANLFLSKPPSPLSSPASSIIDVPRIVEVFDDTEHNSSNTVPSTRYNNGVPTTIIIFFFFTICFQHHLQVPQLSALILHSLLPTPIYLVLYFNLVFLLPPKQTISVSSHHTFINVERLEPTSLRSTIMNNLTNNNKTPFANSHIPFDSPHNAPHFPQSVPSSSSQQQHLFTTSHQPSSIPTFATFHQPQATPVFASAIPSFTPTRTPYFILRHLHHHNLLFPRTDQVSLESILTAERRVNFTQEDIDNFCCTNPNTIGKHRVDTFVNHLDTLYQNSPHVPRRKS